MTTSGRRSPSGHQSSFEPATAAAKKVDIGKKPLWMLRTGSDKKCSSISLEVTRPVPDTKPSPETNPTPQICQDYAEEPRDST